MAESAAPRPHVAYRSIQNSLNMEKWGQKSYWILATFCLSLVLIGFLVLTAALVILLPQINQEDHPSRGQLVICGTTVEWTRTCPADKYTASISDLDTTIENYGVIQVADEVWLCGGHTPRNDQGYEQSKTCLILSLLDGQWRKFEHEMIYPRIKPVMFVDQNRVYVQSGVTSDVNRETGCRDTQEVFDPVFSAHWGWAVEDIDDRDICHGSSTQLVSIDC